MALVAGAALLVSTVTAGSASADSPVRFPHHGAISLNAGKTYAAGTYIVQLRGAPAATYTGGITGYARTRPAKGKQLNAHSATVKKYTSHLAATAHSVIEANGVHALHTYTVAYNGFAARLTSAQATSIGNDKRVLRLTKDRILKVQDDTLTSKSSLNYLKVAGDSGLWNSIGGHANAGKGIVVGDIDTGISPQNPSFAGDPLTSSGNPSVNSSGVISYTEANGSTFTSSEVASADHWNSSDYSTKIIGGQYFDAGWLASNDCDSSDTSDCIAPNPVISNGVLQPGDYISPRDGDDHGSHTASTAAGDYGVAASVAGTNYGTISGVAPAAKIAAYKACWSAPDPTEDGCDEADLVSAINQATTDGVNVINYSIGGGAAETIYSPTDEAFLNATAAGIFVSAAAGNAGPDASTLDNASPWETTVAASTIPSYEATAELGNGKEYVGASITVKDVTTADPATYPVDQELTAPLVDATAVKKSSVSSSKAVDCRTGSLDPKKVAGKIVVCDRDGLVDRVEMSATVLAAGGVGAILTNTVAGDVDLDQHSVPTIHIDQPSRSAIHDYAHSSTATVTFIPWNDPEVNGGAKGTPVPQIAGFSSRGPVKAGLSDTLKPDIAAPGVSILADYADAPTVGNSTLQPQFGFDSGTSMATPHITGLAAVYMSQHPTALPSEVKSALMTSATDTVTSTGADVTNPFEQGAGEVDPTSYLNPGLVYLATVSDYESYIQGTGENSFPGTVSIDPSDLNQASIAIGSLRGTQTVTRTVTAKTAGTYTATIDGLSGVTADVEPKTFTVAAGDTQTFTVKFTRSSAAFAKFVTGSLTWTSGDTTVRSPIAVQPVSTPPASVSGTGTNGVATIDTSFGKTESSALHVYGLAAKTPWPYSEDIFDHPGEPDQTATHFETGSTIDPDGYSKLDQADGFLYKEASSVNFVKFAEAPTGDVDSTDLDLYVLYKKSYSDDINKYKLVGESATPSAAESYSISHPKAGYYIVIVDPYSVPTGGADFQQFNYTVKSGQAGHLNTSISTLKSQKTGVQSFQVGWGGLDANTSYLGVVRYGSGSARTVVNVDTGEGSGPINVTPPAITGTGAVGSKLTASAGTWNVSTKYLDLQYQWLADGTAISGANASTYTPTSDQFGDEITVKVTANLGDSTTVESDPVTLKADSSTSFTVKDKTISTKTQAQLTVTVGLDPAETPVPGTITVKDGSKVLTIDGSTDISTGTATFSLPLLKKGSHSISVSYSGDSTTAPSSAKAQTIKVS